MTFETSHPSRRAILRDSLALTLGATAMSLAASADPEIPIIDTHQHLWDRREFRLPWIEKGSTLDHDFVSSDYAKAVEGLNVVKAIYMEVDVAPEQQKAEADHLIALIRSKKTPTVAAVVSGRPASSGFEAYLDSFEKAPEIKGVRQVLHGGDTPAGHCLSKEFLAGIRTLGKRGLMFDICIRPAELADAGKLIDACPETRFILDHCGNGNVRATAAERDRWNRDIDAVAKRDRVVCKVSGIVASAKGGAWTADDLAPIVNHVLDAFGPDRVMFGGDWPVCTLAASYREWVEALRKIVAGRSASDRLKLFHDNAARVYGIKS